MRTTDIPATVRFLRAILGEGSELIELTPAGTAEAQRVVVVRSPDGILFDIYGAEPGTPQPDLDGTGIIHYAFAVDDVDEAYAIALAAGGREKDPPEVVFRDPERPERVISHGYLYDPNGNVCEIVTAGWLDGVRSRS